LSGPVSIVPPPVTAVAMAAIGPAGLASLPAGPAANASAPTQEGPLRPGTNLRRGDSTEATDSDEGTAAHDSFFSLLG
jgi:hypothetical protein